MSLPSAAVPMVRVIAVAPVVAFMDGPSASRRDRCAAWWRRGQLDGSRADKDVTRAQVLAAKPMY
jgi:hypothetical protein